MTFLFDAMAQSLAASHLNLTFRDAPQAARYHLNHHGWAVDKLTDEMLADILTRAAEHRKAIDNAQAAFIRNFHHAKG